LAQSFTTASHRIDKIYLFVGKEGTPTDSLGVYIYTDDGGDPGSAITDASKTVAATAIADSPAAIEWDFTDADFQLEYGTKYWILIKRTSSKSDVNYYEVNYKGTASTYLTHAYSQSDDDGSTWTEQGSGFDLYFNVVSGSVACKVKELTFGGGEAGVDVMNTMGAVACSQRKEDKRPDLRTAELTLIFEDISEHALMFGAPTAVSTYYRSIGADKTGSRTNCSFLIKIINADSKHINILMNNAYVTSNEMSMSGDGSAEATISASCLIGDFYAEDDI